MEAKGHSLVRPIHFIHPAQLEPIIGATAQKFSPAMEDKTKQAKEHYLSLGAESVYLHAMRVLMAAGRGKLLELSAGEENRLSMELADQILYHPISSESHLPNTEFSEAFIRRFHLHNQFRELDSSRGERMEGYVRLLNNPSHDLTDLLITLYTRIADMMTIHDPATATAASTKMPGVFPVHSSWEDVKVAWAEPMLKIYCPIADWGGQTVAYREMRDNAIRYLHPAEYEKTVAEVHTRIEALRNTSRIMHGVLNDMSQRLGMRVLVAQDYRTISTAFPHVGEDTVAVAIKPFKGVGGLLGKSLKTGLPVHKIHDWAGATIIASTQEQMYKVVSFLYNGAIHAAAKSCGVSDLFTNLPIDMAANPKPVTLYRSVHLDTVSADQNMTPLELIVRTVNMHRWADEGEASHDGYKGCPLTNGEKKRFMQRLAEISSQA
jgi:hypothetical protein